MPYTYWSKLTWHQEEGELARQFDLWRVRDWEVTSPGRLSRAQRFTELPQAERVVHLTFKKRSGEEIALDYDLQGRPVDNLRVLTMTVEAMRMNEVRGIDRLMEAAYLQLAAPTRQRPAYEVLQISPDADIEVAEASYRALSRRVHPDVEGGSAERMAELNAAIEQLRAKS